jgi:hypothetical protein
VLRYLLWLLLPPLALALAAQAAMLYRSEIIGQWPQTRPAFVRVCAYLHCQLRWPQRSEYLAVVGSDLSSLPDSKMLELEAVVRNRAAVTMELPALEVTLSDAQNHPLVRKVLQPSDYLATANAADAASADERIAAGLAPGDDLNIKVTFDAHDLTVAGFAVYPFYP